jgi:hypothetical protein
MDEHIDLEQFNKIALSTQEKLLTTNFANGKLGPGLYSRSDTDYKFGTLYLRDFINGPKDYRFKCSARHTEFTELQSSFQFLLDFIYKNLPFTEVGRIVIFKTINKRGLPIHRDGQNYFPHKNEFIWINLINTKPFFVFDEDKNIKHFPTSQFVFFNDLDFHGVEVTQSDSFSVRVDGKFNDSIKEKLNIKELSYY